jgi:hypothetical protein
LWDQAHSTFFFEDGRELTVWTAVDGEIVNVFRLNLLPFPAGHIMTKDLVNEALWMYSEE